MKTQDAERVLRVLEGVRAFSRQDVHRQVKLPDPLLVDDAIQTVKLELASNSRRGDRRRRD